MKRITLSEDRKVELEAIMAQAHRALSAAACCVVQADTSQSDLRGLRDAHLKYQGTEKDPFRSLPFAAAAVAALREVEEEIIAGFIGTTYRLCSSFEVVNRQKLPGVEVTDYEQEAEWALWDAMYAYDGSRRFTT